MTPMELVRQHASALTVSEKMELVEEWLGSIPPNAEDEDDDGMAEALRRNAEMDADPSIAITWDDIRRSLGR